MGLFSRRGAREARGQADQHDDETPLPDDSDSRPLVPTAVPLRAQDAALRDRCLGELTELGIDLDDLDAIGRGYDSDCSAWAARGGWRRGEHTPFVERWGVAIGEHLARFTDLRWTTVDDPFGMDLGLMSDAAERDAFAVIPTNLVSGRWLNGQTGWIPGVVGHLVSLRAR